MDRRVKILAGAVAATIPVTLGTMPLIGSVAGVVSLGSQAAADTLLSSGVLTNGGEVSSVFEACGNISCWYLYDDYYSGGGVQWQEWKTAAPANQSYFLLTQDGWFGIMPDEPGGPSYRDNDGIQVGALYSMHYDNGSQVSENTPGVGSCDPAIVPNATPVWEPCAISNFNGGGHVYSHPEVVSYEWVTPTDGATAINSAGETVVMNW